MTKQIQVGTKIIDRAGHAGTIRKIVEWKGSRWYEVRFAGGEAVRYDGDFQVVSSDDVVVSRSTEILMSMVRRKITSCGYDISFENMADLKSGIEGELKYLIQVVLDGMIESSQHTNGEIL